MNETVLWCTAALEAGLLVGYCFRLVEGWVIEGRRMALEFSKAMEGKQRG